MAHYDGLTKEEAEDILNYEMVDKEWWNVSRNYSNEDVLKEVLDLLYNSQGNYYTVKKMENASNTRLFIRCEVCNKDLSSNDPFRSHDAGKTHRKNVAQNLTRPLVCSTLESVKLVPLNSVRKVFDDDTLEDRIDRTHHPVLGMEFLYKTLYESEVSDDELFTCQLCAADKLDKEEMYDHLTGKKHNIKYLKAAYSMRIEDLDDGGLQEASEIERREGKMNFRIPTLGCIQRSHRDALPPRVKSSPKPTLSLEDKSTQIEESSKMEDFIEELEDLVREMSVCGTPLEAFLQNDLTGQDVLIRAANVLCQKLQLFALKQKDFVLKDHAMNMLTYITNIKLQE